MLLGLFFITIGMKLNAHDVVDNWAVVLVLTTLPVLLKFVLVAVVARVFGAAPGFRCALACTWRRPASSVSCSSRWARCSG